MVRSSRGRDIGSMAHVDLVTVPYDSGQRGVRMGGGPEHLLDRGIGRRLEEEGHQVTVSRIESHVELAAEIAVTFDLARSIATAVANARAAERLPLVLAGNCFSAVGTLAGLDPVRTGVIWLDAHGDLNTPDTTGSGMLDGMALATLTGRCWRSLAATVPGFVPIPDHRLALVGVRALDPPEEALAAAVGIRRLGPAELDRAGLRKVLAPVVGRIGAAVSGFYLHVDLDVLDPGVAAVNEFSTPGGLSLDDVREVVVLTARAAPLVGASMTALDPAFDEDGRSADAAMAIAAWIAASADGP
jgi:arginase